MRGANSTTDGGAKSKRPETRHMLEEGTQTAGTQAMASNAGYLPTRALQSQGTQSSNMTDRALNPVSIGSPLPTRRLERGERLAQVLPAAGFTNRQEHMNGYWQQGSSNQRDTPEQRAITPEHTGGQNSDPKHRTATSKSRNATYYTAAKIQETFCTMHTCMQPRLQGLKTTYG
jgi:hypothetical protein